MTSDNTGKLAALLSEAQAAHSAFESSELGGVYDSQWPSWYARYLVDRGIAEQLGRDVGVDELARALEASWQAQEADGVPADEWSSYTARRLASELAR